MDSDRNSVIIRRIVQYCNQINDTHKRFGNDKNLFMSDEVYRSSIAFCILQIGELVNNLADDFKNQHGQISWKALKTTRNKIAHAYGTINNSELWNDSIEVIPELNEYCSKLLPDYTFKEVTTEQLELLTKTNIDFKTAARPDKIIIKYNKDDEAAVHAAISPPDYNLKR